MPWQNDPATHNVSWTTPLWQAGLHLGAIVGLAIFFGVVVPPIARMFIEFDLPLPPLSVLTLNLSNSVVQRWFFALPLLATLFACDVAVLVVLRLVPRTGPLLSGLWFAFGSVGLGLIAIGGLAGIVVPLMALSQGLSS